MIEHPNAFKDYVWNVDFTPLSKMAYFLKLFIAIVVGTFKIQISIWFNAETLVFLLVMV